jgi:hypothetical protein
MRQIRLLLGLIALAMFFAMPAGAQLADLIPGARIRLTPPFGSGQIDGTIVARTGDSIVLATPRGTQYHAALGSLRRIDLYRGRSQWLGLRKGATWGAAIMAVPAIIAYAEASPRRDGVSRAAELRFSLFALGIYTGTGAIIGFAVRSESWDRCAGATAPTCGSRP